MTDDLEEQVRAAAARARVAAAELAPLSRARKDAALLAMADALAGATDDVIRANAVDVAAARAAATPPAMIDRLTLSAERIDAMAAGLRDVAALADPVGEVVRGYTRPNGLEIRQIRVPFGVVAMVYEARPNVTVDAAGLALKSGNAALLRGSGTAHRSNEVLVDVLAIAAEKAGLPRRLDSARPRDRSGKRRLPTPRPRPGRLDHPAGRRRADQLCGSELDGAGDRDRRRQRAHLR